MQWFHTRFRSVVATGLASVFVLSSGVSAFGQSNTAFEQAYPTAPPITLSGAVSVSVSDDFAKRRSETVYALRDAKTGHAFTLRSTTAPRRLRGGTFVTVSGRAHGADVTCWPIRRIWTPRPTGPRPR